MSKTLRRRPIRILRNLFGSNKMWICAVCGGKYLEHPYEDVPEDKRICAQCYHRQSEDPNA